MPVHACVCLCVPVCERERLCVCAFVRVYTGGWYNSFFEYVCSQMCESFLFYSIRKIFHREIPCEEKGLLHACVDYRCV